MKIQRLQDQHANVHQLFPPMNVLLANSATIIVAMKLPKQSHQQPLHVFLVLLPLLHLLANVHFHLQLMNVKSTNGATITAVIPKQKMGPMLVHLVELVSLVPVHVNVVLMFATHGNFVGP